MVRKKHADIKTVSKCNRNNPTNTNALKLKKAQNEFANIYLKEQTEYIQNQIDKIRDSVEDKQSWIAWQTVNEVSRWKSTAKAKLKATRMNTTLETTFREFTQKPSKSVVANMLNCNIIVSLNSSYAIIFTCGLIPLRKV